jgi:hypothetical protein
MFFVGDFGVLPTALLGHTPMLINVVPLFYERWLKL